MVKYGVKVVGGTDKTLLKSLFFCLFSMLIFLGIWMFVIRRFVGQQRIGGGMVSIGKSKAKIFVVSGTYVTFDDVAGVDEAKVELQEIVAFLKKSGYLRPSWGPYANRSYFGRSPWNRQVSARPRRRR